LKKKKLSVTWNISNILGGMITDDVRCAREIKSRIFHGKRSIQQEGPFHQPIGSKFREETSKMLHLGHRIVR
jgi:hypothetical protein